MHRLFSLEMPFTRFVRNVALVSIGALIPAVLLYIATRQGFGAMLLGGGPALSLFVRQLITNGLPVVLVVNYVSFFLFAWMNAPGRERRRAGTIVLMDIALRLAAFFVLHALIYVLSADWFGSFGGSRITALGVVAPTLARSVFFENISGAYLYATMASALPLYVDAVEKSPLLNSIAHRFPAKSGPVIIAGALFAVFALGLAGVAALGVQVQAYF